MRREDLRGTWAMEREAEWSSKRREELAHQALEYGLESANSIHDRSISLFDRGSNNFSGGGQFMGVPFLEDMRALGGEDVAIVGVPLDWGPPIVLVHAGVLRLSGVFRCLGQVITHQ